MRLFQIATTLLCLVTNPVSAAILTVSNLNDNGPGSLRDTIAGANSGDTIVFSITGTISLTTGELVISKNLIVDGPGATTLIVERIAVGAPVSRVFNVTSGTVTISDLTIREGFAQTDGGGIRNEATLTLNRCTVANNRTRVGDGGGIYNSGTLTLNDCAVDRNRAGLESMAIGSGGGIYNENNLTLNNCSFFNNLAPSGGGGAVYNGANLIVNSCSFRFNVAVSGGAIDNDAMATVVDTTFSGNDALNGGGGAIHTFALTDVTLTVEDCYFTGNEAQGNAGNGGAIASGANSADATTTVTRCTFKDNRANRRGGAIENFGNTTFGGSPTMNLSLINCTLVQNIASSGGAISNLNNGGAAANIEVRSCTLSRNGHSDGSGSGIINDVHAGGSASLTLGNTILQKNTGPGSVNLSVTNGGVTSQGYNLADDDGGGLLTASGDQINADPILDSAGLQNNGGPTPTIALMAGSPALDRGLSFGLATDQRGLPRPWDLPAYPPAAGGDDCDIGAFESRDALQASPIFVNTAHDHDDGVAGAADCTLREAIARANAVGSGTVIAFVPALSGTIVLDRNLGPLTISGAFTLTGPGPRFLAVSADGYMRVLTFLASSVSTVSGLTLRDGFHGFGLQPGETGFGGGVLNAGTLTLNDCTLDDHSARGEQGPGIGGHGGLARGGGIYNDGVLTLNRCTLRNCIAGGGEATPNPNPLGGGGHGGAAEGAGIYNAASGSLTVNSCTFTLNEAGGGRGGDAHFAGNGGSAHGGAIFNLGTMLITAATVSGNKGLGGLGGTGSNIFNNGVPGAGTGGVASSTGSATLRNTLCAGNTARGNIPSDVFGAFTSQGYNLIGTADASTGFNATGDRTGTNAAPLNAQLGPLQNNGGPIDTLMLLAGSPAIDRGKAFGLSVDQRGLLRTSDIPTIENASGGDGTDIGAAEFTGFLVVTTLDDHDDGMASPTDTTLREAINAAIPQPGTEVISFLPGLTGIIQLTSVLPNVSSPMLIEGPGADVITVRRHSGGNYRVFTISNNATVTIAGLTVTNGNVADAFPADSGGGIFNDRSILTLRLCHIMGNNAVSGFSYGGGVFNYEGTLVIESCIFSANNSYYGGGLANYCASAGSANASVMGSTFISNTAGGGYGGAIFNSSVGVGTNAPMTLTNCTLSGNSAAGGFGGAVYTSGATNGIGSLTLTHCTLSGNSASSGGGIYNFNFNGITPVVSRNSIFNTGSSGVNLVNDGGTISSQGYNLSNDSAGGDGSTGPGGLLNATGDIRNTDPLLGALASNGGPTPTHMPLRNSPAFDRGKSFGFLMDQRGLARLVNAAHFPDAPDGDGADIGALEINPFGSLTDEDGDGMPDEWEIFYGVDDPSGDPDNDVDTNLKEYGTRTNPRDNGSFVFRIISILPSGNNVVITFNGVAGRTFRLERKDELSDPDWLSIPGLADLTPSTTGNAQLTHLGGLTLDHSFYRVRLLP